MEQMRQIWIGDGVNIDIALNSDDTGELRAHKQGATDVIKMSEPDMRSVQRFFNRMDRSLEEFTKIKEGQ